MLKIKKILILIVIFLFVLLKIDGYSFTWTINYSSAEEIHEVKEDNAIYLRLYFDTIFVSPGS